MTSPFRLLLMGPPGSGKGTQAARISERYQLPVVATGDILRDAVKAHTPLGFQVQTILSAGGLVGDEMMIDLVFARLRNLEHASRGFILDGFPRTLVQADALDAELVGREIRALHLHVPDKELERRLTSRRICTRCKALHTSRSLYGSEEELCSKCGSVLITRDDDNIQVIRNRLRAYKDATDPLIARYVGRGALRTFDGTRPIDEVTSAVFRYIEE